jgi:amino acid transporter
MVLLQEAISASPFFILAIVLLAVGFASLLYNVFKAVNSKDKKLGTPREPRKENKITTRLYIIALIIILIGVIFFINWVGKIQYD